MSISQLPPDILAAITDLELPEVKAAELDALFDEAPVGIAYVSKDGMFLKVNQSFCDMFGYASSELVGKHRYQDILHPQDVEVRELEATAVAEGKKRSSRMSVRYIHKRGQIVHVDLKIDRVEKKDNMFVHFIDHNSMIPLSQDFYRVETDANGEPALRPFYPLGKLIKDNWKAITGILVPVVAASGTFINSYYTTKAKLDQQTNTIDEQRKLLDDVNRKLLDTNKKLGG